MIEFFIIHFSERFFINSDLESIQTFLTVLIISLKLYKYKLISWVWNFCHCLHRHRKTWARIPGQSNASFFPQKYFQILQKIYKYKLQFIHVVQLVHDLKFNILFLNMGYIKNCRGFSFKIQKSFLCETFNF